MTWGYFLNEKSETFVTFKKFKALVEMQKDWSIKTIRSDRGGEYTSREFEEYYKNKGIQKQLPAGYTPPKNGVSERRNRNFFKMAITMVNEKGLPKYFWAEAVHIAVHNLIRCPTKALKDKTPVKAWSGIKPSEGDIQNHKARLVARGFTQKPGIDFYETFSPVARLAIIRSRSKSEATLHVKKEHGNTIIVCLHVDDLLFTGNDVKMMQNFKQDMLEAYEMSDLGLLNYLFGIEVSQVKEGIFISHKKYTKSILQKFKMMDCRSVDIPIAINEKFRKDDGEKKVNSSLYRNMIGSLLYLTSTREDIMFAASLLSRFMQEPSQVHFGAAKRVLRYFQGTMDYGITYKFGGYLNLIGYFDSDCSGSIDDMKSTSGYVFLFGSSICSWLSKKKSVVAQFTAEAKYVSASKATS
ncbi:uncharacterized mitochondrial protein AtMg00810-like [Solanum lycopersicum]|uniref:uncharacterized mitochondrial protein AtMg00810-like n=1 Tax=Solanum lycopersicum TaxID=4081 RepID=UPI0037480418